MGNRIRFSVHDTREESEIIHRHGDFTCGVGVKRLRPIVVRCIRGCELEQVGVEVKCFRGIFRVDISIDLEVFSIAISTTKTPHYLLEAHGDTVVFFAIPRCDAVEVLFWTRKEFGNIAELVISSWGCKCIAVFLLERRHLFWIFKQVFPVDVASSIDLGGQCPVCPAAFRIFGKRRHRGSVDRIYINIFINPIGEIDIVLTLGVPTEPLAVSNNDVVQIAFSDKSREDLILEVGPRNLDDIDSNTRFGGKVF